VGIVFSVKKEEERGFAAECFSDILHRVTIGKNCARIVHEAATAYFLDQPRPPVFRLVALLFCTALAMMAARNAKKSDNVEMSSILEQIKPETAEMIAAEARSRGLSVDEYLRSLLPQPNGGAEQGRLYETTTPGEWVRVFREWAASHSVLPMVADDSRESIYRGRGE
jgi:hypothetical protein